MVPTINIIREKIFKDIFGIIEKAAQNPPPPFVYSIE